MGENNSGERDVLGMAVVAGSILSAGSGNLVLNPVRVERELSFYAVILAMLVQTALGEGSFPGGSEGDVARGMNSM